MNVYVLSREAIEKEKRKGLIRGICTATFALAIGSGIPIVAGLAPVWILAVMVPFFIVIFSISFRRGLKILEENRSSYQLLLGSDFIVRKQLRLPDVEIHADQVTHLEERKGAGLLIRTADRKTFIQIPEGIERYEELKGQALRWRSLDSAVPNKGYGILQQILAILSFAAAFAVMWLSSSVALVMGAGIFVIVYMISSLVYLKHRKDIDPRLKLSTWKILFLILALSLMLYGRVSVLLTK
jgi:hypothetical protein